MYNETKTQGVLTVPKIPEDAPQKVAEMARLYAAGATMAQVSEATGVAEETARRWMKAAGVQMRPRGCPEGKYTPAGGRQVDRDGYVLVLKPSHPHARASGYVLEHRLVMEEHLGRTLLPEEVVHHKNGQKDDNRLENLQLFESQSPHHTQHILGNQWWKMRKWRNPHAASQPGPTPPASETGAPE